MGLLRALPRSRRRARSPGAAARGRHLQDPRQVAEDRPPDAPGVHAQHRRRRLVERLPHAGAGQDSPRLRRLQHGPVSRCPAARSSSPATATASGRPSGYPHIACNCSSWTTTAATSSDRPPQPRHGPAPGRADGRPDHVQLAGIAGAAQRDPVGPLEHPPRRHQLGPARQRLPDPGGAPNAFHFQTQLSDGSIVVEEYYNQNNSGFGTFVKLPPQPPDGYAAFGPAYMDDPRNPPLRASAGSTTARPQSASPAVHARTASSR